MIDPNFNGEFTFIHNTKSPPYSLTEAKMFIQTPHRFKIQEVKFREHIVENTNLHYDRKH